MDSASARLSEPVVRNGPLIVVVGELCVDVIVRLDGPVIFGQHEQIVPLTTVTMGSSSAITACGIARLGASVELVSVRGADDFGEYLDSVLRRREVGTAGVRIDASLPTGSSVHLTRADGDRAILTAMGSIGTVTTTDARPWLAEADHLHVGSWFLQHALEHDADALFAEARAVGVRTSLDGNFDPSERWNSRILDMLEHCDLYFGNDEELSGISGSAAGLDGVTALLSRMPEGAAVVRKTGADGAELWRTQGGELVGVHAGTPVLDGELCDTVGAGDSLAAGVIYGIARGLSDAEALALGVACGSLSTRAVGGIDGQPDERTALNVARTILVSSVHQTGKTT